MTPHEVLASTNHEDWEQVMNTLLGGTIEYLVEKYDEGGAPLLNESLTQLASSINSCVQAPESRARRLRSWEVLERTNVCWQRIQQSDAVLLHGAERSHAEARLLVGVRSLHP